MVKILFALFNPYYFCPRILKAKIMAILIHTRKGVQEYNGTKVKDPQTGEWEDKKDVLKYSDK